LREIALYGEEYVTLVETPHQVIIQQSVPFRMQYPKKQTELFNLLSRMLYYLVSGFRKVGYVAGEEWK